MRDADLVCDAETCWLYTATDPDLLLIFVEIVSRIEDYSYLRCLERGIRSRTFRVCTEVMVLHIYVPSK